MLQDLVKVMAIGKEEQENENTIDMTDSPDEANAAKSEQPNPELREQLLRLAAEFDNYKKRVKKEIENSESMGKASLIVSILPIIDEFDLAMLAIINSKDIAIARGMEMLYSNLIGTLKREGLEEIAVDGVFDPYKHEIVLVKEDDAADGTILEVVKKGYSFGGRMLRPASVIIAKKMEKRARASADNKKDKTVDGGLKEG